MDDERNQTQMEQLMEYYLEQARAAEPGSKEMTALNDAYAKLYEKLQKDAEIELAYRKDLPNKEEIEARKEEEAKERKHRRRMDIVQVIVPPATGLLGLGAVLLFEVKDVVTSKAGMSWIGKLLKWTK